MIEYTYESQDATLIISADDEDNVDQKLAELVREPNTFDLVRIVAV